MKKTEFKPPTTDPQQRGGEMKWEGLNYKNPDPHPSAGELVFGGGGLNMQGREREKQIYAGG